MPSPSKANENKVKCGCIGIPFCQHRPGLLNNILVKFQQKQQEHKEFNTGKSSQVLLEELSQKPHLVNGTQRQYTMQDIITQRRLILVLDLDNTLLHSSPSYNRQVDERIRKNNCQYNKGTECSTDLFVVSNLALVTKLRPHARAFIEALHPMYDIYVYTLRKRSYATTMAQLLDPQGCFIRSKVISSEDSTVMGTKALDVLCTPETATVIVDDTMDVWRRDEDQQRVINIKRYYYTGFRHGKRIEEEEDTILLSVLTILKRIHSEFFSYHLSDDRKQLRKELPHEQSIDDPNNGDVSVLLRNIQSSVLHGCCIVFSGVFHLSVNKERHAAWILAERLGASCSSELDVDKVTHVITRSLETGEAHWATTNGKFLVSPEWLDEAFYTWTRPLEKKFSMQHAITNAVSIPRISIFKRLANLLKSSLVNGD